MRKICAAAELVERGLAVRFSVTRAGRPRAALAIRYSGQVFGYLNECAHVPIELDFNPGDVFDLSREYLICSTHGAYYQPDSGVCVGGPCAGRRLQAIPLVEQDGAIWLSEENEA
ncbi:Rieske 2Fe-2S domain-containing protein [Chitinibacter tainanensis]|uniref:Rieske (2Fe-2S) protein n=1 Tax=Chitinibacter tainanensis TaxID=230667 RepID=UPI0023563F8B|nr:Rieske 2Fe-2S domain-containing protein [Chitinibacter tainanensis]